MFSGMGSQWVGMGRDLMNIDTFQTSIMRSCEVLNKYNINLYDMLMKEDGNIYDSALNSFVSIVSIQVGVYLDSLLSDSNRFSLQVALVDVLTELGIQPDGLVGHSVGELGCAYADGGLTAEEAILAAYWRGRCIKEANIPPGAMAAVGEREILLGDTIIKSYAIKTIKSDGGATLRPASFTPNCMSRIKSF